MKVAQGANSAAPASRPESLGPSADVREGRLYQGEREDVSARDALDLFIRSWPFIARHRRLIALKFSLAVISTFFFLLTPWPLKIVIDNVIDGHPLTGLPRRILFPLVGDDRLLILAVVSAFLALTAILVGIVGNENVGLNTYIASGGLDQAGLTANEANVGWSLSSGLFGLLEVWITLDLTQRINHGLRTAIYERLLASPLALFSDQKIGDAVFRVMHDSASIGAVLYRGVLAPLVALISVSMAMAVIGYKFADEPLIPLLALAVLPIIAIGSALFGRPLRTQAQRMHERGADVMAAFEERLAHVRLVKAFGQEMRETFALDAVSWESFRSTLRMLAVILLIVGLLAPLVGLLFLSGLYHLLMQVIEGRLSLGDVVLLVSYAMMIGFPAGILASSWAAVQPSIGGLRRIHSVLDRLGEFQTNPAISVAQMGDGPISTIEFRDLAVGYDPTQAVLEHVSLVLRRGELTALAGASASGKSTLIAAIPGFVTPLAGALLINGRDARELDPRALRARIGFVFQQEALFSESIAYNIAYANPRAGEAAIHRAAAMAGAAAFIESLPAGYATILGRRGARLSTGQTQRIAIARALLRNPEVLILDEPTAPLDPRSEADLMATLRTIAKERIVLVVTHRPLTLAACDRVLFIEGATVAASGAHAALLESSPGYRAYLALRSSDADS